MKDKLKEYLHTEWRYNVHPKYLKYFEEWYNQLTEKQRLYYNAYMDGNKTPFTKQSGGNMRNDNLGTD